jgi:cytidine deaminase
MAVLAARMPALESVNGLFDAAKRASANAYAEYSGFRVGAAVLAASGKVYAGCNVENVAYPLGTCAEAAAIATARAAEGSALEAVAIAIYATKDERHVPCTPCGGCRQRIFELGPDVMVWFYGADLKEMTASAAELLPHAFKFDRSANDRTGRDPPK